MKKYIFFFITVLILVFLSACIQQEINSLSLPEKNKIIKAYYITENGYKSMTDKENINNLLFELSLVHIKSFDSLQDTPRVDEYSEINFELSTGTSSNKVFVYKMSRVAKDSYVFRNAEHCEGQENREKLRLLSFFLHFFYLYRYIRLLSLL